MDEDKLLEMGIQGIKEASARSRIAFVMTIFACGTVLITLYNNYFSWNRIALERNRGLVEWPRPTDPNKDIRDPETPKSVSPTGLDDWKERLENLKQAREKQSADWWNENHKEVAKELAENQSISISLLGIKFSSGDLNIFGTIGMLFLSGYYLLCVRRMSLEVESMYQETPRLSLVQQQFVYSGVRQSYVLNTIVEEDLVQGRNSEVERLARSEPALHFWRWLFPKVTFLPFATVALIVFCDWWYVLSEMRHYYGSSLWWWSNLEFAYKCQFILMDGFAVVLSSVILAMNVSTYRFQRASAVLLTRFRSDLEAAQERDSPGRRNGPFE